MTTVTITKTGPQWIDAGRDGMTVTYSLPAGCVLRRQDGEEFVDELRQSPFVHAGAATSYRIDCDVYDGIPKTATLTIA